VRIWKEDLGPLIPKQQTDFLIGLEPLETIAAADEMASKRTTTVMSSSIVPTQTTLTGAEKYPKIENIENALREICGELYTLDATDVLQEFDNTKALNMFFLGAMIGIGKSPLSEEQIIEGIKRKLHEPKSSLSVFKRGIERITKMR
jgi:Pyruvate/2-oxoacid:ferredoxin oxidoreductase gamma subunit